MGAPVLPTSAVFYSPLDGDLSASRHNLTLVGGIILDANGSDIGGAYKFNGFDEMIEVASSADLDFGAGAFVIEFIIRNFAIGQANYSVVISKEANATSVPPYAVLIASGTRDLKLYMANTSHWDMINGATIGTLTDGVDAHVAIVRSGTNVYAYFNGSLASTSAISTTAVLSNIDSVKIGGGNYTNTWCDANISNIRMIKGDDNGWTGATITVPTKRYSASDNANTVLLIDGDGDISTGANDMNSYGSSTVDSDGGGGNFNGAWSISTTNRGFKIADSTDFNFGSGDFTISTRFVFTNGFGTASFYSQNDGAGNQIYLLATSGPNVYTFLVVSSSTTIAYYGSGTIATYTPGSVHHLELVRSGTSILLFVDGISIALTETTAIGSTAMPSISADIYCGGADWSSNILTGNLCEYLVLKGEALNTTAFTPETEPYRLVTTSSIGVDIARSYRENALTGANISREWIANATIIGIDIARDHRAFQTATINIARGIKGQQITGVDISRSMRGSRIIGVDVSHNIKGTAEAAIFIDRKFLTLSGFHIYVDNVFQGVTTDGTLAGIPLADGSHSIEIRPSGDLWEACRYPTFYEIEVASGEIVAQDLPDVVDLRADDLTGWGRDIFWIWQNDWNVETPTEFGLWFGDTSPVTISGTPDATVTAQAANRNHSYRYAQTAAKYVSVAARNAAGDNGTATELLLSYPSGSISSPTWQDAREGI